MLYHPSGPTVGAVPVGPKPYMPTDSSMSLLMLKRATAQRRVQKAVTPSQVKATIKKSMKTKTKKSVSFAPTATVTERPISAIDLQNMWYDNNEYKYFEFDRRRTILAISQAQGDVNLLNPEEFCVRGLEHQLTSKQCITRKLKTMQYTRFVLDQQDELRYFGVQDPESLKLSSEMLSRRSQQRAHLQAMLDSQDI